MLTKKAFTHLFWIFLSLPCLGLAQVNASREMVFLAESTAQLSTTGSQQPAGGTLAISGQSNREILSAAKLSFDLKTLPAHAKIIQAFLLVYKPPAGTTQRQNVPVTLYFLQEKAGSLQAGITAERLKTVSAIVGYHDFVQNAQHLDYEFVFGDQSDLVSLAAANNRKVELLLSTVKSLNTAVYSSAASNPNYIPRLKVVYELDGQVFTAGDWPQLRNNPQNNARPRWESNAAATGFEVKKIASRAGGYYFKEQPMLVNGLLVLPVSRIDGNGETFLNAYTVAGNARVLYQGSALKGTGVNYPLLVDSRNRVVSVVKHGEAEIFNLADGLKSIASVPSLKIEVDPQQVTAMPIAGTDGSLYVPTLQGLLAFTPDYRLKWRINPSLQNHFSTPALSTREDTLYVINGDKGQLLIVDNATGAIADSVKGYETYVTSDAGTHLDALPVPMVDVSTKMVFAYKRANLSLAGNGLLVYKQGETPAVLPFAGPVYSQPLVTKNGVYVVHDHRLKRYRFSTENDVIDSVSSADKIGNEFVNLAQGINGEIYALSIGARDRHLFVFDSLCRPVANQPLDPQVFTEGENLLPGRLSVAPDGSLFTASMNSLFWIAPSALSAASAAAVSGEMKDHYVYRFAPAAEIKSDAVVKRGSNTLVYPLNGIRLSAGFKVEKGAQFRIAKGAESHLMVDTAGNIGIGTAKPQAALDVNSLTGGFIPPRMDIDRILELPKTEGAIVFNTTAGKLVFYNGKRWMCFDGSPAIYEFGDIVTDGIVSENYKKGVPMKTLSWSAFALQYPDMVKNLQ